MNNFQVGCGKMSACVESGWVVVDGGWPELPGKWVAVMGKQEVQCRVN